MLTSFGKLRNVAVDSPQDPTSTSQLAQTAVSAIKLEGTREDMPRSLLGPMLPHPLEQAATHVVGTHYIHSFWDVGYMKEARNKQALCPYTALLWSD